jgi:hypothetical protein
MNLLFRLKNYIFFMVNIIRIRRENYGVWF